MDCSKKQVRIWEKVVGVDAHPDVFTALELQGSVFDNTRLWLDTDVPVKDYRKWLTRHDFKDSVLVFESSANSFELTRLARQAGVKAIVIDSRKIGQIRKAYCENDKMAAEKIALAYLGGMAHKSEVWQPDEMTLTRRQIISTYDQATKNTTRFKNQIRGYLNEHVVRLPKKFDLCGQHALEKILTLRAWNPMQQQLLELKISNLFHAYQTRERLRAIIVNETKNDPIIANLMQLCGIRAVTAFAIIASIGDIDRFATPKKLVSYIGVTPGKHQSGNSEKDLGMTNYGVRALKSKIFQAAQAIMRSKNRSGAKLRNWGVKLMYRKGKLKAIGAIARKLVVAIWYQLKGLMPPIIEKTEIIRKKIKHIVGELDLPALKSIGYGSKNQFFEDFWEIINSRT